MNRYQYLSLTKALDDKHSPLREYFDTRFPKTRTLQADYRARVGEMVVAPGNANSGTVGTAFDYRLRFTLDPSHNPGETYAAFLSRPRQAKAIQKVILDAQRSAQAATDPDGLNRACWALALCTEVYRTGQIFPGSPLASLSPRQFTSEHLLALAPADALRQLNELARLAQAVLVPRLTPPLYLGPTFEASEYCAADADLISNRLLLDIKTTVKGKALSRIDLYQLLGYALFDRSDAYAIRKIGIYASRFGALVEWELAAAMELLAGEPVALADARETVWGLLTAGGR